MNRLCKLVIAVAACLALTELGESSKETIDEMTANYIKSLDECKKELNLPDSVQKDFDLFWHNEYEVTNRLTGCAIICLHEKLDKLYPDVDLHDQNLQELAQELGADEQLAQELVTIIDDCGEKVDDEDEDECMMVLEWAKCFKDEIHKRKMMNPSVDVALVELAAEV